MNKDGIQISVIGHVNISEKINGVTTVLRDEYNAVHPQNMARILARALANEPNSHIWRLALGNGGTTTASDGTIIYKTPNDGSDGSGWESRLYNETYSEIVDDSSSLVGTDPGSADANIVRPGGGAVPTDDPAVDNTVSQEVGTKSNVIVTLYLNENEPNSELSSTSSTATGTASLYFDFNELGLYSSGLQARDSSGYSSINVGNKTSTDISSLIVNTQYTVNLTVDGVSYTSIVKTPTAGTGTAGAITYGDICEGINTGAWVISGDPIQNYVYVYITDNSNGTYPSILSKQSYGYLNFQSTTTGSTSFVTLICHSGSSSDFFNSIVSGICGNVNNPSVVGGNAGVQNDPVTPTNERERLLTHLIFAPIRKTQGSQLIITYTLTLSVNPTVSTVINEVSTI